MTRVPEHLIPAFVIAEAAKRHRAEVAREVWARQIGRKNAAGEWVKEWRP